MTVFLTEGLDEMHLGITNTSYGDESSTAVEVPAAIVARWQKAIAQYENVQAEMLALREWVRYGRDYPCR